MKTTGMKKAKENLTKYLKASQKETVIVTRRGKPVAAIIGVRGVSETELQALLVLTPVKQVEEPAPNGKHEKNGTGEYAVSA